MDALSRRFVPVLLITTASAWLVFANETEFALTGVWKAQMDGVPALVLTISDEGGELSGAILFYSIRHDDGQPARSTPGNPEPLFNLKKTELNILDFRVSHRRSHGARTANDPPVQFRLKVTGENTALLIRAGMESIGLTRDKGE